jgi:hypothetical protein
MSAQRANRSAASIAVIAAAVVLIISALLLVGESRYRSCIARAEAEYPAVPVSSFNSNQTGPLKVSFVAERSKALDDCGRI